MRIQLFNAPTYHYAETHYRLNPGLGLPIIAAMLDQKGHQVEVWDLEALRISPASLRQGFAAQRDRWPDAVGIHCNSYNARGAREVVETLRQVSFEGYIVVGGPHVTIAGNADQGLTWGADCVVVGECEGNVERVFAQRQQGVVQGVPLSIDEIPSPLWKKHLPRPVTYLGNQPKIGHPEGISMWSRGCPHGCVMCANPVFGGRKTRHRPAENIREDMQALRALGARSAFVYDDQLVTGNGRQGDWLRGVCEQLAPLRMTWKCQGRCSEKMELETLKAMRAAGCRAIMWGIESFSDGVLENLRKDTTEADIWHSLRLAKQAGIGNWAFLMVGNYGETAADLEYTEKQLARAQREGLVQWRQVTVCTPYPGSKLWSMAEAEGWLVEPPEVGPQMGHVYAPTPWLTKKQIAFWKRRLEMA